MRGILHIWVCRLLTHSWSYVFPPHMCEIATVSPTTLVCQCQNPLDITPLQAIAPKPWTAPSTAPSRSPCTALCTVPCQHSPQYPGNRIQKSSPPSTQHRRKNAYGLPFERIKAVFQQDHAMFPRPWCTDVCWHTTRIWRCACVHVLFIESLP